MKSRYQTIPLDKIIDPEQPLRSDLSPESVEDLVHSISQVGIIEPLVVSKKGELFEVIAGHRRLLAATIAGVATAPCMVTETSGIDLEVLKMHENIARSEINPIDWAKHLDYLKSQYNLSSAKLSEITGMSDSWVDQHLAILKYPPEILDALASGGMAFSSARELAQIKDDAKRKMHVEYAVKGGVTPALAAKWRREANLTTLPQPSVNTEDISSQNNPVTSTGSSCPVCGDEVQIADSLTITIHHWCRPDSALRAS